MEIICWLYLNEVSRKFEHPNVFDQAVFFSSKGHDAPALYSVLLGLGSLDFELLHRLRRLGGLPGHPDIRTPGVVTNTGSLGMGVSKAKGLIFANRLSGAKTKFFVLTGDGELQEGQLWESLISASNRGLYELTVVVDHNKLQSDTLVSKVSDLGDLEHKFASFGWHVLRCDGNDIRSFSEAVQSAKQIIDRPQVIIADTVKGSGVSFMEHTAIDSDVELYRFHSGAPSDEAYSRALGELVTSANKDLEILGLPHVLLESVLCTPPPPPMNVERMISAYSEALIDAASLNEKIVALDADLVLDTGLIEYQKKFPNRFIECGIAEQDMISQAGGLALAGLIPIVHSFACFLTSRPSGQIYNNCTEQRKIVYVGSLAGALPGGPGHSHQAVRDIAAMSGMPGVVIIEPVSVRQVVDGLEWAVNLHPTSAYLRLTSVPIPKRQELEDIGSLTFGAGHVLVSGGELTIVVTNPILVVDVLKAAERLNANSHRRVGVIATPWINVADTDWYGSRLQGMRHIVTVESHYIEGGFGMMLTAKLAAAGVLGESMVHNWGVGCVPPSGTNSEVLAFLQLDADSIASRIDSILDSSVCVNR